MDIIKVTFRYGSSQGQPLYDSLPGADHADANDIPGLYAALGPPDGGVDLKDVLAVIMQFGHNCGRSTRFTYDTENRLVSKIERGVSTSYVYDGQGALVKKAVTSGTTTTNTVYVNDLYEDQAGTVTKYYWFNGQRVAMRQNSGLSYLLQDHLGSTTTVLSSSGYVLSSEKYYPFGKTRSGAVSTDKQFTGSQQEGDFYFMQSRFYDPYVGRFLQPDSIVPDYANPQSLNRYSYVMNNPLRYTDPTGYSGAVTNNPNGLAYLPRSNQSEDPQPGSVPEAPPVATPCPPSFCPPAAGGFGPLFVVLQMLPGTGDVLDVCMYLTGRDCLSWQKVPEWQQGAALVSLLSVVGFARYADEGVDVGNAARRAASGGGRSLDDALSGSDRQFRRWMESSVEGEAARAGHSTWSAEETSRILNEAHRRGWHPESGPWEALDVSPHPWVGGPHYDLVGPSRETLHFPVPEGFIYAP